MEVVSLYFSLINNAKISRKNRNILKQDNFLAQFIVLILSWIHLIVKSQQKDCTVE